MGKIEPKDLKKIKKGNFYCFNPFYLTERGFMEESGAELLVKEIDPIDNNWDYIYLPDDDKHIGGKNYVYICDEDIERINKNHKIRYKNQIGEEYAYIIERLIKLDGPEYRKFRKAVNRFERKYNFKILDDYPAEKCLEFLDRWKAKKPQNDLSEQQRLFFDISFELNKKFIQKRKEINHKGIYIEVDGVLVGFRLATQINNETVVGVMQKVDYSFEGIAKYLYYLTAKSFPEAKYLTLGTGTMVDGVVKFKESLRPDKKIPLYYVSVE